MKPGAKGPAIAPPAMEADLSIKELVDRHFNAYNAARLREACQLWARALASPQVTVGLSLSGALTPAGLGASCLVPLVRRGLVDFLVSTGANLYHDAHYALGLPLFRSHPDADDVALRRAGLVRIYDIVMDQATLLDTDAFFAQMLGAPEFSGRMGSAEFHYRAGGYLAQRQEKLGLGDLSLLAACRDMEVPVYCSSPGDSAIGMNAAALSLTGTGLRWDVNRDVNETAALVLWAKRHNGRSGVVILGGGSPKNFLLQTEPYLQEILGIAEAGHDYFLQITDARPDTGGLSGATPSEAVSWGKVDPQSLPNTVVCYCDTTIALPLLTAYVMAASPEREPRRLYQRREEMVEFMRGQLQKGPGS